MKRSWAIRLPPGNLYFGWPLEIVSRPYAYSDEYEARRAYQFIVEFLGSADGVELIESHDWPPEQMKV